MRSIEPQLDPLAQRAAIEAMQAQRAAYRRYAQLIEGQQQATGDGSGDSATAATDAVTAAHDALQAGVTRLQPLLDRARATADAGAREALDRHLDDMLRDAHLAEAAIHTLTAQLQAWRDAYGKQLAEVGLTPGAGGSSPADAGATSIDGNVTRGGYGLRGRAGDRLAIPSLIDRRG